MISPPMSWLPSCLKHVSCGHQQQARPRPATTTSSSTTTKKNGKYLRRQCKEVTSSSTPMAVIALVAFPWHFWVWVKNKQVCSGFYINMYSPIWIYNGFMAALWFSFVVYDDFCLVPSSFAFSHDQEQHGDDLQEFLLGHDSNQWVKGPNTQREHFSDIFWHRLL